MCSNALFLIVCFLVLFSTVRNQGRWVIHFIKEMEKVYKATGDKKFNIILIDYNSTDIDVEKELKNANIPR